MHGRRAIGSIGIILAAALPCLAAGEERRPPPGRTGVSAPAGEVPPGGADESPDHPADSGLRDGLRGILDDGKYLCTFPSRLTKRGVMISAAVVGVTGYLLTRDEEIRDWIEEHRSETSGDLERIFEPIGRASSGLALTGGAYLIGRWGGRDRLRRTSAVAFESFLYTGAITAAAKGLFARERPGPGSTGRFWEGESSFPSGHTSRTFAIATVFAESYGPRAGWVAYPVATLVGLARLEDGTHWASDVLAGGALGMAIGKALARRHELRAGDRASQAATRRAPRIGILAIPGGLGLRIHLGR